MAQRSKPPNSGALVRNAEAGTLHRPPDSDPGLCRESPTGSDMAQWLEAPVFCSWEN